MIPCARWTNDCQGKKDYDGQLLSISTRYWPSPGYGSRPSAKASIVLNFNAPDEYDYKPWRVAEFDGDTEAEVKAKVEAWVQERFDEVCILLGLAG